MNCKCSIAKRMEQTSRRYFVVEVHPASQHNEHEPYLLKELDLYHAILDAVEELHGEYGVAAIKSGFQAKYCNEITRVAIIRARHGPHRLVGSSLNLVTTIGKRPIMLQTLYIGATIVKCYHFLKKHQQQTLNRLVSKYRNNPKKKEEFEKAMTEIKHLDAMELRVEK
uniref:Ribonuclease P/MRP protein subunit POP5 n=1 Tax=Lynceus sp. MCZ IZ 141354 TaxID=1930659 RepID=A0A9N6ZG95_9CRUS|nr:EOG090X0GYO [Lynceus sp. MCZ IZ 141354]